MTDLLLEVGHEGHVTPQQLYLKGSTMLNALKFYIINALGGKIIQQQLATEAPKAPLAKKHGLPTHMTTTRSVVKGFIYPQDVLELTGEWSKSSVANNASWICLAKAWQAYEKMMAKMVDRRNPQEIESLLDGFHAWNSVSPKPYDEDGIEEQVIKMCIRNVPKGNAETDAIRARVRGMSVNQFKQERERMERLKKVTQAENIRGFLVMAKSSTPIVDGDYKITLQQAIDKLDDTMRFLADPSRGFDDLWACATIKIIEGDIEILKTMTRNGNDNNDDFVDGVLTADHMMRNTTLRTESNRGKSGEASKNPEVVSNKQQFEDWLAAEHAA